jgi:hypothetical protein
VAGQHLRDPKHVRIVLYIRTQGTQGREIAAVESLEEFDGLAAVPEAQLVPGISAAQERGVSKVRCVLFTHARGPTNSPNQRREDSAS